MLERRTQPRTVTWTSNATSNEISIDGFSSGLQLFLPAEFAGAAITYETKTPAGDWVEVHSAGSAVSDTVTADACNKLSAGDLFGLRQIRLVSDETETCSATLQVTA